MNQERAAILAGMTEEQREAFLQAEQQVY